MDATTTEPITIKPDVGNGTLHQHFSDQVEISIKPLVRALLAGLSTFLTEHNTMILCAPKEGTEG